MRAQAVMRVENRVVEHHAQALAAECVGKLAHHVALKRRAHHAVWGGGCVPDAEAAVVLGGEAAVGHSGTFGCLCPLRAVEFRGVEQCRRGIGVGPILGTECWHIKVDEHAETQVDKRLLQLLERLHWRRLLRIAAHGCHDSQEQCDGCFFHNIALFCFDVETVSRAF